MTLIKSISGIRGTIGGKIGESLSPIDIVNSVLAFGKWIKAKPSYKDNKKVVILGRDARTSGKMINRFAAASLQSLGIKIIDLGLTTTPTLTLAVKNQKVDGGIIITASHNPAQWNALKLVDENGEFLTAQDNKIVFNFSQKLDYKFSKSENLGVKTENINAIDDHVDAICALDLIDIPAIQDRNFRVLVDCVNSTGALIIPQLLKRLGVEEVKILYDKVNGIFPHNPEPLTENLGTLISEVKHGNFDLGFAVDPDVDRLVIICEDGTPFNEEYTLVAISDYILERNKGSVVSNLSSSQALKEVAQKHGVNYYASKVGEVNVIEVMKTYDAVIGGEGNGGIIYPPLHYSRDALVGIGLFLSHLANFEGSVKKLKSQYPDYTIAKDKIDIPDNIETDDFLAYLTKKYKNYLINTEDGLRVDFDKEWIHIRKSNTEPIIRVYAEASSLTVSKNLCAKVFADLREYSNEKNN